MNKLAQLLLISAKHSALHHRCAKNRTHPYTIAKCNTVAFLRLYTPPLLHINCAFSQTFEAICKISLHFMNLGSFNAHKGKEKAQVRLVTTNSSEI